MRTATSANELSEDAPLAEGHVVFAGMVTPTKGGYRVRDAIIEDSDLQKALAGAPGRDAKDADWFLGAVVRIEGELHKQGAPRQEVPIGMQVQQRSGQWLAVTRIDSATIVKTAQKIEGTVARSKGFFAVAGHLINHADFDWALGPKGAQDGDHVRIYGQARTVTCEPNAQCLIGGSLPLFDVARAERIP